MKLSKKSEYGVRALVEIALRSQAGSEWHQISQIADTTRIPEKFLEQILLVMKNGGLLKSRRGIEGGYALNTAPEQIHLDQIVALLDGFGQTEGGSTAGMDDTSRVFHSLVAEAQTAAQAVLQKVTLSRLVAQVRVLRSSTNESLEYHI
ncbi:MAG: Rrf2 family transcriptional regulator [Methylacidiphilales bacterium]|nr:Rrf2 family transcriptional regulator [Candidatus Methylacidiphilales bacterium]